MKKRLVIIGIVVLLAVGAGVFVWERNIQLTSKLTLEELEKQLAAKQAEIDSIEQQLKDLDRQDTPEKEAKRKRNLEILTAQNISDDVSVEGVEIIKQGDKKIIKNNAQGYSMEIPLDLVIARSLNSDRIEMYKRMSDCGDCKPDTIIKVYSRKPDEPSFNEEVEAHKNTPAHSIEKIIIQGTIAYRIHEFAPDLGVDTYFYLWERDQKIYSIQVNASDDVEYRSFIETFKFK